MGNTIKRNSTKMTIRTKLDSLEPKDTIFELHKDEFNNWVGGGYCWLIGILRNNNFIEILEQK